MAQRIVPTFETSFAFDFATLSALASIVLIDLVLAGDNAVAGASGGSLWLLLFGLGLSIPLVVCASGLLSRLMDRFPIFIYIGAAVLGKVAAEMILTDPMVAGHLEPSSTLLHMAELAAALGVVMAGRFWLHLARVRAVPVGGAGQAGHMRGLDDS